MTKKVRVRFAPSPTGYLHIGGLRTALFNYLFAKKHNGTFVLRVEDTDQTRYVEEAEQYIYDALKWLNIDADESPAAGGNYGPYRQSERKNSYQEEIKKLIDNGTAYYAFDTAEEMNQMREEDKYWKYGAATRMKMKNSLTLTESEVTNLLESGAAYTIRFKMPENQEVAFTDVVRGEVKFNTSELDDKILMKSDGMPTYHLANICDDHAMEISHVIRGEEWLSSTPLHVMLYKAFAWEAPTFAHLPLILKPSGKGKLSKRDGEAHGFPVFPLKWFNDDKNVEQPGFKEIGYLPKAFMNMIVFLGWNAGTDQEIFSEEELIEAFSLEKVQKGGARFDWEKAKWFNQQYLQNLNNDELKDAVSLAFPKYADNEKLEKAVELVKERMIFVNDFENQASYIFDTPTAYDEKNVRKRYKPENIPHFEKLIAEFENLNDWKEAEIEANLKSYLEKNELGFGAILPGFRLMLTGIMGGPSVFAIAEIIGKENTLQRMKTGMIKFEEIKAAAGNS